VAIKLLRPDKNTERFVREVNTLRGLRHQNLVGYLDSGVGPQGHWLVMPLVQGVDLETHLREQPPTPATAARLLHGAALGVAAAHAAGVVHRDLKPANLFVRLDGRVLVGDFGLAVADRDARLTRSGVLLGTLAYMAPEQAVDPRGAGPAADVWSLGAILYRMLCGRGPREGDSQFMALANMGKPPTPPRELNPDVPEELEVLCLRCLAEEPGERPSASELAQALALFRSSHSGLRRASPPRPRRGWGLPVLAGFLLTAGVGLGVWATLPEDAPEPDAPAPEIHDWSLGVDAPPRLEPPEVWDAEGHRVQPLTSAGLASLFLGEVREVGGGAIEVDYTRNLPEALTLTHSDQLRHYLRDLLRRSGQAEIPPPFVVEAGRVRLYSPNNFDLHQWRLGRARWTDPQLQLTFRQLKDVDLNSLLVIVEGELGVLIGRRKLANFSGVVSHSYTPSFGPVELSYAPFAESQRVVFDGVPLEDDPGPRRERRPEEGILVAVSEAHVQLDAARVRGIPTATDLPAWATVAHPARNRLRAELHYRREAGKGGPLLALRDASGAAAILGELDEAELRLWVGGHLLTSRTLPHVPSGGTLVLERDPDVARLRLTAGGVTHTVEAPLALPLGAGLQLAYGSRGPTLEVGALHLDWGEQDDERARYDATRVEDVLDDTPQTPGARLRWAFLLALLALRQEVALALGRVQEEPEDACKAALEAFDACDPPPELAAHVQAWRIWAALVGLESERCLTWARTASEEDGETLARFQELRFSARQALQQRLLESYTIQRRDLKTGKELDPYTRDLRALTTELALCVTRGRVRDSLLVDQALNAALEAEAAIGEGHLDPDTEARAEEALRLLALVEPASDYAVRHAEAWGVLCLCLGRPADGLPPLERLIDRPESLGLGADFPTPLNTRKVLLNLLAADGRMDAVAARCLEELTRTPNDAAVVADMDRMTQPGKAAWERAWEGHSGLRALLQLLAAEHTLRTGEDPADAQLLRESARASALAAGPEPDDADLGSYVRTCLGEATPRDRLANVDRPYAILTRARRGERAARERLPGLAETNPMLRLVVRLDPELAPLLR